MRKKTATAVSLLLCAAMAVPMAGCGDTIDGSAAAITVNDESVSVGTANFMLRASEAETVYMMQAYGLTDGDLWDTEVGSDETATGDEAEVSTYGDSFKKNIADTIEEYVILRQHAAEKEVSLSEEEQTNISETAKKILDSNAEAMEKIAVTQENIEEVLELYTYQSKMREVLIADVDTEVSDEEACQHKISYARLAIPQLDEDNNEIEATDELKASYMEDAEKVLAEVLTAEDPAGLDFNDYVNGDDAEISYTCNTITYGDDDTTVPDEVKEAVSGLEDGQICSEVVVSEDEGYYIVRMDAQMDEESTESEKETIVSERQDEAYENQVDEWKEASTITLEDGWKNLKVTDKDTYTMQTVTEEDADDTGDVVVATADETAE